MVGFSTLTKKGKAKHLRRLLEEEHVHTLTLRRAHTQKSGLNRFWQIVKTGDHNRILDELKALSGVVQHNSLSYAQRRAQAVHAGKDRLNGPCVVCAQPAQCRHHVIQIQNGGSNDRKNIVGLCHSCHADIHPWLTPDGGSIPPNSQRHQQPARGPIRHADQSTGTGSHPAGSSRPPNCLGNGATPAPQVNSTTEKAAIPAP